MKLLYDHEFFGYFGYSGIGRYFTEIINRMAKEPDIVLSWYLGFHRGGYQDALRMLPPHWKLGWRRPSYHRLHSLCNWLDKVGFRWFANRSNADLLHQTYYRDFYPDFKGKRIITLHDMTYEVMPGLFPDSGGFSREKKNAVQRADGIIAISESTRNDLVRIWNTPSEKIKTILHGTSLSALP